MMVRLLLAVMLVAVAGCGQSRIKATSAETLKAEIERVAKTLDKDRAAEFTKAVDVLMVHAMLSDPNSGSKTEGIFAAINGKSPDEIIDAYNQLGPQLQMELGGGLAKARKAASDMKEANGYLELALKADEKFRNDPATKDDTELNGALFTINQIYNEKRSSDDYLAAAKWLSEQMKKPPGTIKAEFGTGSPSSQKLP